MKINNYFSQYGGIGDEENILDNMELLPEPDSLPVVSDEFLGDTQPLELSDTESFVMNSEDKKMIDESNK